MPDVLQLRALVQFVPQPGALGLQLGAHCRSQGDCGAAGRPARAGTAAARARAILHHPLQHLQQHRDIAQLAERPRGIAQLRILGAVGRFAHAIAHQPHPGTGTLQGFPDIVNVPIGEAPVIARQLVECRGDVTLHLPPDVGHVRASLKKRVCVAPDHSTVIFACATIRR